MSFRRPVRTALVLSYVFACAWLACASTVRAQRTGEGGDAAPPTTPSRSSVDAATLSSPATQPARTQPSAAPNSAAPNSATEPNGKSTIPPAIAPTVPPPRASGPPVVEEVRPELYYLKNDKGDLEPILGFTYDDFYRLYRLEQKLQQGAKPPAFRFESAMFSGKVANGRAEFKAELRIVAAQAGWTRVPLGLASAMLVDSPERDEPGDSADTNAAKSAGKQMLLFDAGEGYVLWLHGDEGQTHSVVLERLLAPVEINGDESRLRLALPRSLSSAEVWLSIPLANAEVKTSDAAMVVSTKAAADGTSDVAVTARGGDLQISWRGGSGDSPSAARFVEATSAIRATIDDRSILWEAQLTVRSLKGPLESFDVRLPAGAELDPVGSGGYVLSVSGQSPRIASVSLRKPTTEAATIRLVCRRARDASTADEDVDFAGFSVVDAARQSGALVVAIDGDWRIAWQERTDVRQAEQPPDSLAPPDDQQAYAFEFYRQPFALLGRISPQPTRLDVEPQFHVAIEADRLVLTARLMYKVRGAKVSRVQLQLGGWELEELGPPGMIHAAGAMTGDDGTITVPLAQRMRASFELTVRASRPLTADAKRVDFALPGATADAVAPPVLVVEIADNVDLMPVEAEMAQLAPRSGFPPAGMSAEKRRHPPLVYRVLDDGRGARFVADRTIRARETFVESATDVQIERGGTSVEQRLDLRVAYEALNRVVLDLPAALAARRDVSYSIDGVAVLPIELGATNHTTTDDSTSSAADSKSWFGPATKVTGGRRIALEPPTAILDRARITIRHSTATAAADSADVLKIPLVMPGDATVLSNAVRVSSTGSATFASDGAWTPIAQTSDVKPATAEEFRANGPADEIALRMLTQPRRTTVHAMWIRTTAAGGMRQDRVAFRVQADQRRLEVALPHGAHADRVAVWVDRRLVAPSLTASASSVPTPAGDDSLRVGVDLPVAKASTAAEEPAMHTVELLYDVDGTSSDSSQRSWEAPRVLGDVWQTRTWWEVVVPRGEHIAVDPSGFTPEYAWQWSAAVRWGETPILPILGRRPNLSPNELQRLTGATPIKSSAGQSNRYLFSTSGPVERIEFHTLPRWLIVLLASGAAIAVGLALIYAPIARRPVALLSLCVVLVAVAIWSPSAAILGGQAAAVGLLLSIGAGIASWWLGDRVATPTPANSHSDRVERGSSASRRPRDDRSRATTLTVPAELDIADVNT
ncbi:MAG: hypothetical protein WD875_00415 [Pirellulales bacterium]